MRLTHLLSLFVAALLIAGCTGRKDDAGHNNMSEHESQMRSLPALNVTDSCKANGHLYVYTIDRVSNDSLGTVMDEFGDKFANTLLTVTVKKDGLQMFHHTFKKENFKSYVDEEFMSQCILDGCRFDKVDGGQIIFVLAVSYPDSDMSQPLRLTIAPDGSYSVSKEDIDYINNDSVDDGV